MKKSTILILLCLISLSAFSQFNCWIQFKDKNGTSGTFSNPSAYLSERAIDRRIQHNIAIDSTDFPVSSSYVQAVLSTGVTLKHASKWLNGITVSMADTSHLASFRTLPFIKKMELTQVPTSYTGMVRLKSKKIALESDTLYGNANVQLDMHHARELHNLGYRGNGMVVGVLDGGFYNANQMAVFDSLRQSGKLLGTKDFSNPSESFYNVAVYHGSNVLSVMAANQPGKMIGAAPDASYWLIRTEYGPTEYKVEVDNWVAGIEFADSVGVDVVNSSLAYNQFDYSPMNFSYQNMDGKTSRASVAATMASRKGMIVVVSAGNDGSNAWHYISTPADADSILTVGAVDVNWNHAYFSSWGPTSDGRVKPDICAVGYHTVLASTSGTITMGNGTSFASPIIAGITACLWQSLPQFSNMQIINLMKEYSSNYTNPNDSTGYGIPNVYAIYQNNNSNSSVNETSTSAIKTYFSGNELVISGSEENAFSSATLYSITGNKVKTWTMETLPNISLWNNLPKGVYILSLTGEKHKRTVKIVKP